MSDAADTPADAMPKRSRRPMLIGLLLMLLLGGGGFYAVYSGMILGDHAARSDTSPEADGDGEGGEPITGIAFVPIPPLTVSLGAEAGARFLHFTAQVEVGKPAEEEITMLMPRIVDVLNSYLRAVETRELSDPTALVRLRSQMLRRVQLVTGDGKVRDLLISEFVIN